MVEISISDEQLLMITGRMLNSEFLSVEDKFALEDSVARRSLSHGDLNIIRKFFSLTGECSSILNWLRGSKLCFPQFAEKKNKVNRLLFTLIFSKCC